jgi:hypothetical protein
VFALLLPGALIIYSAPSASAATTYGRVTVSGANILVNGAVPTQKFFGVVDTTALQFAILAYINGETQYAGKTSVFNGPDTSNQGTIPQNANPTVFWNQYFALLQHYNCNLVRIGCADSWGTDLQYQAWINHQAAFVSLLDTMFAAAQAHGVYVVLVLAGSQDYPAYQFGGSGSVFVPSSSAYNNYITYSRGVMSSLEGQTALAWYDLFNEPDHDKCWANFWSSNGGKTAFHTWASDIAAGTAGASTHPRTMGTAALGAMFGWNKGDFDLATGAVPFEIAQVHYYGSNSDANNFALPEQWAKQDNKPLLWGELGYNAVYPLTRYTFGENTIWSNGGQAITSMVLTGTSGYPYTGGQLPDPVITPPPLPELKFTSSPTTTATVGSAYAYTPTTSIACTLTLTSDAGFLTASSGSVSGTPDKAGSYGVRIAERSSDGRTIYQNYTLVVAAAPTPPAPPVNGGNTTNGTTGGNTTGGTTGNMTAGGTTNQTASPPKTPWSWLSGWFKDLFGGGRSPTVAGPIASQSAPASKSSGFVLGGAFDALLVIGAMVAAVTLVGAYLVISKKKKE